MKHIISTIIIIILVIGCKSPTHQEKDSSENSVYYTCSMDPQVMENKPGKCPICHMDLTPVSIERLNSSAVKLSESQVRLGNIKTLKLQSGSAKSTLLATGIVKENQDNIRIIAARFEGRIEQLFVKTKGVHVQKGQVLFNIYSEILASAQSEYMYNWQQLKQQPHDPFLIALHETATRKLLLWGLSKKQVEELKLLHKPLIPYPITSPYTGNVTKLNVSQGSTLMEGDILFELSNYNSMWVEAQLFQGETADIQIGSSVSLTIEGSSNNSLLGEVIQILPQVAPSSNVKLVRILVVPKEAELRPGMQVTVGLHNKKDKTLVIPSRAILRNAKAAIVWTQTGEDTFEPNSVLLGKELGSTTEILTGLQQEDLVVINGAYLLQSEYDFKKGTTTFSEHALHPMETK